MFQTTNQKFSEFFLDFMGFWVTHHRILGDWLPLLEDLGSELANVAEQIVG